MLMEIQQGMHSRSLFFSQEVTQTENSAEKMKSNLIGIFTFLELLSGAVPSIMTTHIEPLLPYLSAEVFRRFLLFLNP